MKSGPNQRRIAKTIADEITPANYNQHNHDNGSINNIRHIPQVNISERLLSTIAAIVELL